MSQNCWELEIFFMIIIMFVCLRTYEIFDAYIHRDQFRRKVVEEYPALRVRERERVLNKTDFYEILNSQLVIC